MIDLEILSFRLLSEDRNTSLKIRHLNIGEQTPLKPGTHAILEATKLLWRHITRDDNLLAVIVQSIERMEEGFLGLCLALEELNVVDQKDIHAAISSVEGSSLVICNRIDEIVREIFGAHISNPNFGKKFPRVVTNCVKKVGLP